MDVFKHYNGHKGLNQQYEDLWKIACNTFRSRAVRARKQIRDVNNIQDSASSSEEQKEKQLWKEVTLALWVDQEPHETDPTETLAAKY